MTIERKKRKRVTAEADEANEEMNGGVSVDTAPPRKKPKMQDKDAKESSGSSSPFRFILKRTGSAFVRVGNSSAFAAVGRGGAGLNTQEIAQQLSRVRCEPKPTGFTRERTFLRPPDSIANRTVLAAVRSVSVFFKELNDNETKPTEARSKTLKKALRSQEERLLQIGTCTDKKGKDGALQSIKEYFSAHPEQEEKLPATPPLDDEDAMGGPQ